MSGIAGSIRRARQKRVKPWRDCGGFAGHGRGALDDRAGAEGFGVAGAACERAGAPRGRGAQAPDRDRSDADQRPRGAGGARQPRRPDVALALDLQELARSGGGIGQARAPDQSHGRGRAAPGYSLHANRKTKEGCDHPDRDAQSGIINQATKEALAEASTGHFRGHEEKGAGRGFQERGARMAAKGDFEDVRVHDFLIKELGRAVPYGGYDLAANEGFCRRGRRRRYGGFRGADASRLVDGSRLHQIPQRQTPRHHRRRRRLEWFTGSPVETRVAAPRRRTRPRHRSSPLPAGNEQMEQGLSPRRRGSSIACSRSSR